MVLLLLGALAGAGAWFALNRAPKPAATPDNPSSGVSGAGSASSTLYMVNESGTQKMIGSVVSFACSFSSD
ncbi:MAG: hypothetical protein L6R28_23020, partial [Planctomycetes bacterium]|nr:hypothetical protein [Planctomycetota bacterium]